MENRASRSSLGRIVLELLHALAHRETYDPRRNLHALFGLVWGIPVPLFSIGLDLALSGSHLGAGEIVRTVAAHPIHVFFLAHPLLFLAVFGAMGTVRRRLVLREGALHGELERKNGELDRANASLRRLDRLRAEFVSNATNEILTPLGQARGNLGILRREISGQMGTLESTAVANALRALDGIDERLRRLAGLARLGEPEPYDFREVDLASVVRGSIDTLRPRFLEKGLDPIAEFAPGTRSVRADPARLAEAVEILLVETAALAPRGARVEVRIEPAADPERVRLRLGAIGASIPARDVAFLGESAGDEGRRAENLDGSGLPLAVAATIVREHGGQIDACDPCQAGELFRIEIPAAPSGNPEAMGVTPSAVEVS